MLATARCAALVGVDAVPVRVEADVARRGLPGIHIVGLVETAVRESQVRIRSALKNCGYRLPGGRITVSLAPADMPKSGSGFDLSIAWPCSPAPRSFLPGRSNSTSPSES